jgi:heme-degrading monooxygenase HmoA
MYIAMNRFWIKPGKEDEFEKAWKNRESFLKGVAGFKEFRLLKGANGTYISHSTWENENAFTAWMDSEAFAKAHAQGASKGLTQGPPEFSGYDVIL